MNILLLKKTILPLGRLFPVHQAQREFTTSFLILVTFSRGPCTESLVAGFALFIVSYLFTYKILSF